MGGPSSEAAGLVSESMLIPLGRWKADQHHQPAGPTPCRFVGPHTDKISTKALLKEDGTM